MSLEDLEIRKHTQPIQAELDKQKDKNGRLKAKLKRMREAFMHLAPSIAVLARDDRHAPSTRSEMLEGEKLMLASLTETLDIDKEDEEKFKDLDVAVQKFLAEAHAIGGQAMHDKISKELHQLRKDFGPQIAIAWSMGHFYGPCLHGRDPYTRCDECGDLEPIDAWMKTQRVEIAKKVRDRVRHVLYGEFPNGPVDEFIEKLDPSDLLGE